MSERLRSRAEPGSAAPPADPAAVVAAALTWLGTPYHHQASVKGIGCDCLGLARGVWRDLHGGEPLDAWGGRLPAYSRDWGEVSGREALADAARAVGMIELDVPNMAAALALPPGTLALFRMRERGPAKHCGILVGDGAFVHAPTEGKRVMRSAYTRPWARRLAYAFFYPRPVEKTAADRSAAAVMHGESSPSRA